MFVMSHKPLYSLRVAIEPMGKQRPKASVIAGHAHIYTPTRTLEYEHAIRNEFATEYPGANPTAKPVRIAIQAFFPLNKGDYKKDGTPTKAGCLKIANQIKHTKKPDFDNLAKAAVDALNGIAWVDDSQICEASVRKAYALSPSICIDVYEL